MHIRRIDIIPNYWKTLGLFLWVFMAAFLVRGATLPTASETADAMTIGWNLGNTLEAIGGETAWGNPATTQRLIDSVKAAGFNTVRLPVAWDNHANQSSGIIDAAWMSRIKEVVDYCIRDSLYVILNIHWDNGWLENNCTADKKDAVNKKQKNYWTQIADYFKQYNGRLLFASANEPNAENADQLAVLMSYHTTFIDAVRASGGNNATRVLIVQGPCTDIDKSNKLMNTMPADPTTGHLMFEVHFYTPWNFCGMTEDADWGKMFYFWGKNNHSTSNTSRNPTWGEEGTIDTLFRSMKTKFVDKGIPVIIGEYGVIKRTSLSGTDLSLHNTSREYYYKYVTASIVKNGMIPIYWDNGVVTNGFSLFDRTTGKVVDRGAVKALMDGASVKPTAVTPHFGQFRNHTGLSVEVTSSAKSVMLAIADPSRVGDIAIFDQLGRCIRTYDRSSVKHGVRIGTDLDAGIYFVRIHDEKGSSAYPFVKLP